MHITVSVLATNVSIPTDIVNLDVGADMTLADLKAAIQSDINVAPSAQYLFYNNQPLASDTQTLSQAGVVDGDMLGMQIQSPQAQRQAPGLLSPPSRGPAVQDTESIRLRLLGNPAAMEMVRQQSADMADAVMDSGRFHDVLVRQQREAAAAEVAKEEEIARLNADPFNIEAQQKIEEMIHQQQVMDNLQTALEHMPEAFGRVSMLYIPVQVNGENLKAFVDSGAQVTIMSPACAQKCNIMRLVDTRYGGIARGVGTAAIVGRIHAAPIRIGDLFLTSSFTVMEGKHIDLLLGLDMLKRFQACVDLKDNVLRIDNQAVPFLPESEIPRELEEEMEREPVVPGRDGAEVGARSGAVTHPAGPPPAAAGSRPAPASSSASQSESSQTATPAAARVLETKVSQVIEIAGVSREQAVQALEAAGGDVEAALGYLIG